MAAIPLLCSLLVASQTAGLTVPPKGLGVRQSPPSLTVMRGETATLSCHFQVQSLKYGVQWFRMKSGKQLIPQSPRHVLVEKNQNSSLVITEVAPQDSGKYYCEVNVLHRDPERGNGTLLNVLAPPSVPTLYLQTPADPETEHWALVCVTEGFYPSELTLSWTNQSAADPIDHLPINNCTLSSSQPGRVLSEGQSPQCVQMVDIYAGEVYLFSVLPLPDRQALNSGVTFTCVVEGHPAMTAPLTASYTWEAPPNQLIAVLNIVKMCFLSAVTAVFLLEGNQIKQERRHKRTGGSSRGTNL